MLNRVKRVKTVAKKQHHFRIKFTGIFTLRVLLAVKISFEGFISIQLFFQLRTLPARIPGLNQWATGGHESNLPKG